MISLSLSQLVALYLSVCLGVILGIWLFSTWRTRRRERRAARAQIRCRLCNYAFTAPGKEELPFCPQCGAKNERRGL